MRYILLGTVLHWYMYQHKFELNYYCKCLFLLPQVIYSSGCSALLSLCTLSRLWVVAELWTSFVQICSPRTPRSSIRGRCVTAARTSSLTWLTLIALPLQRRRGPRDKPAVQGGHGAASTPGEDHPRPPTAAWDPIGPGPGEAAHQWVGEDTLQQGAQRGGHQRDSERAVLRDQPQVEGELPLSALSDAEASVPGGGLALRLVGPLPLSQFGSFHYAGRLKLSWDYRVIVVIANTVCDSVAPPCGPLEQHSLSSQMLCDRSGLTWFAAGSSPQGLKWPDVWQFRTDVVCSWELSPKFEVAWCVTVPDWRGLQLGALPKVWRDLMCDSSGLTWFAAGSSPQGLTWPDVWQFRTDVVCGWELSPRLDVTCCVTGTGLRSAVKTLPLPPCRPLRHVPWIIQ